MTSIPHTAERAVQVVGSTVYVLNAQRKPSNLWWATVQPGFDDEGRRLSDEACKAIAQQIADALEPVGEGWQPIETAPKAVGEVIAALEKARDFVKSRKAPGYDVPCMQAHDNINRGITALASLVAQQAQPTDEQMDAIMRVCMNIADRYAFVGDAAFPRGREKLRAAIAAGARAQPAEQSEHLAKGTQTRDVKMMTDWIEEALTYVGSPSWSPSMVRDGNRILAAINAQGEVN